LEPGAIEGHEGVRKRGVSIFFWGPGMLIIRHSSCSGGGGVGSISVIASNGYKVKKKRAPIRKNETHPSTLHMCIAFSSLSIGIAGAISFDMLSSEWCGIAGDGSGSGLAGLEGYVVVEL
jgi:hypothetical protein